MTPKVVNVKLAGTMLSVGPPLQFDPAKGLRRIEFRLDPAETTDVASVPISSLMAQANFVRDAQLSPGGHPSYHFYVNGWDVWGVTARIIVQFLELAYDFDPDSFNPTAFQR